MKLITAIIQPNRLDAVKQALSEVEVFRMTVSDVQGYGQQKGHTEFFRGQPMNVNLIRKVKIVIACNDSFIQPTIDAIIKAARTDGGKIGDGKIFVQPLEQCIRIRTGETGSEAI